MLLTFKLTFVAILISIYYMAQGKFTENIVRLRCGTCNHLNYIVHKNKKLVTRKLELKKHCPYCNKHTPHKEAKK